MATASATASEQGTEESQDAGHVHVLIVGAGVSGIGVAHHLRDRFPTRNFVILDAQDNRGGTWWTHRYPGVRSDSDLFTYGYRFKPWRGPSIAAGEEILNYLDEVIAEDDLSPHIRYRHRVTAASWSTEDRRWTVEVTRDDTGQRLRFTTDFLWMCQGYYNHAQPYRPQWEGMDRFQGVLVHPQMWPDDLDLVGKRVVVIGSGSTASTLIPAIAEKAAHVTMLQRSPTYFIARPTTHELAVTLRALDIPVDWTHEILRRAYIAQVSTLARMTFDAPDELHTFLIERVDLVADLVCRLLAHMQERGATVVVPTLRATEADMARRPWCDPENFNAGYVMRSQHIQFRQGDREPWTHMLEHEQERESLPMADLDDGTLVYR